MATDSIKTRLNLNTNAKCSSSREARISSDTCLDTRLEDLDYSTCKQVSDTAARQIKSQTFLRDPTLRKTDLLQQNISFQDSQKGQRLRNRDLSQKQSVTLKIHRKGRSLTKLKSDDCSYYHCDLEHHEMVNHNITRMVADDESRQNPVSRIRSRSHAHPSFGKKSLNTKYGWTNAQNDSKIIENGLCGHEDEQKLYINLACAPNSRRQKFATEYALQGSPSTASYHSDKISDSHKVRSKENKVMNHHQIAKCKSSELYDDADYASTSTTSFPSVLVHDKTSSFRRKNSAAVNRSTLLVSQRSTALRQKLPNIKTYYLKKKSLQRTHEDFETWHNDHASSHARSANRRGWQYKNYNMNCTGNSDETQSGQSSHRTQEKDFDVEEGLYQTGKKPGFFSKKTTLVNLTPNGSIYRGALIKPSIRDDEEKYLNDVEYLIETLEIALTENKNLKGQLRKYKKRNSRLNFQICDELEKRSKQHQALVESIQNLRNIKSRIKKDTVVPGWISKMLRAALNDLVQALLLQPHDTSTSEETALHENQNVFPTSLSPVSDSVCSIGTNRSCKISYSTASVHESSENTYETQSVNPARLRMSNLEKERKSADIVSSASFEYDESSFTSFEHELAISNIRSTISVDNQNTSTGGRIEVLSPSQTLSAKQPPVPILSLKEKSVGCGAWLSGHQTQGDTYIGS